MSERQPRGRTGKHAEKTNRDPDTTLGDDISRIEHVLPTATAAVWRTLAPLVPAHAYLAGGTAIAVHLQHRVSRDLDFFTQERFDSVDLLAAIEDVGEFIPTTIDEGTLNGLFESTKVQFLDATAQTLIEKPLLFGGIRVAQLPDLMATKLKVIRDRGALRDYFDLMVIEQRTDLTVEEGLGLVLEKYKPHTPEEVTAGIVHGLGFFGDVEDDPSLPARRNEIENYWQLRQPQIISRLG